MEGVGIKQAVQGSSQFLNEPVRAALYAMPKGGLMRTITKRSAIAAVGGAVGAAIASGKQGGEKGGDTPPNQLAVALTDNDLVLIAAKMPLMGFPKPQQIWRRLPKGTYHVKAEDGKVVRRFTVEAGEDAIHLEAKVLAANHGNAAALDEIVRSGDGLTP